MLIVLHQILLEKAIGLYSCFCCIFCQHPCSKVWSIPLFIFCCVALVKVKLNTFRLSFNLYLLFQIALLFVLSDWECVWVPKHCPKANGKDKRDVVVENILRPMTPKFDYVVCAIEDSKRPSALTIDELYSSLLVHEQHTSYNVEEDHILKVTHGGQLWRKRTRTWNYKGRGHEKVGKALIEP